MRVRVVVAVGGVGVFVVSVCAGARKMAACLVSAVAVWPLDRPNADAEFTVFMCATFAVLCV